jgi:hypothetical protein
MFYSKGIQNELLGCVEERIKAAQMRKDPTLANFKISLKKFTSKA